MGAARRERPAHRRAPLRLDDPLARELWRYPPGTRGKRHSDPVQEEVFVVLEGTLTVDLGDPPERHQVGRGDVLVVQPGTILQLRNSSDEELVLFIYGAPPERAQAEFFPDAP